VTPLPIPFGRRLVHPEALVHANAVVDSGVTLGSRTRVWAFAHIVTGAVIGEDCNICDHTFVEGNVRIGDRVTIKCGVYLWDGLRIEDDVFVGPSVVFTNALRPRSKQYPAEYPLTFLKQGSSFGANCTILPDLTVGRWAMVGAGAVVTRSVPDYALVLGNPAKIHGWVCRCGEKLIPAGNDSLSCSCGKTYRSAEGECREQS